MVWSNPLPTGALFSNCLCEWNRRMLAYPLLRTFCNLDNGLSFSILTTFIIIPMLLAVSDDIARVLLFNYLILNFSLGRLVSFMYYRLFILLLHPRECSHRCLCPVSLHSLIVVYIHGVAFLHPIALSLTVVNVSFHGSTSLSDCFFQFLIFNFFLTSTIWLVVPKQTLNPTNTNNWLPHQLFFQEISGFCYR